MPQTGDNYLLADHLGVMLGFMAWCIEAKPSMEKAQPELFFATHFGAWLDLFCEESLKRLQDPDTQQVVRLFQKFIALERQVWTGKQKAR